MAEAHRPVFVADPACVYFPVSTLGNMLRQYVRVINVGSHSARLGVPYTSQDSPCLRASVEVKQGYISSGLHQDVEIQYFPDSFDVVRSNVLIDGQVRCSAHSFVGASCGDFPSLVP